MKGYKNYCGRALIYNDLRGSASPPEEVAFRLRPEDEELVQRPGWERRMLSCWNSICKALRWEMARVAREQ